MPTNIDAAIQRAKELAENNSFKKVKWYKWKAGKNTLRVVPGFDPRHCHPKPDFSTPAPEGSRDHFAIEVRKSNKVGPNNRVIYLDPNREGPLEQYIDTLQKRGDEASKKEADAMRPKNRVLFFVIDRDAENEGPQCIDWNLQEYAKILQMLADPEYGDIACPFNGCDLVIEYVPQDKSKNGFAQWTSILARRTSSPLTTDPNYWMEWLGVDYFVETSAGRPTDPEYIVACLEGRDKDFNSTEHQPTHSSGAAPDFPFGANAPHVESAYPDDSKWWTVSNGTTIEATGKMIRDFVLVGQDPQIMPYDQSQPWGLASQYGFKLVLPAPPVAAPPVVSPPVSVAAAPAVPAIPAVPAMPAMPAAATAPVMPPMVAPAAMPPVAAPPVAAPPMTQVPAFPSFQLPGMPQPAAVPQMQVPESEAAALERQLAQAAISGSQPGQDLRAALGGR